MRIWSLHPAQLDRVGLVACWRETLLAQAVLRGKTSGYKNHPQLIRFREQEDPLSTIGAYLSGLHAEAQNRGYKFDKTKIFEPALEDGSTKKLNGTLPVTSGQLDYEWQHLGNKLKARAPEDHKIWASTRPLPHPLFFIRPGEVEDWERT